MFENYTQGSAAGVSLLFLFVWMIGDITNLIGSIWAELVPTVTALAVYFCIADTVLILQCLYYNNRNARKERKRLASLESAEPSERDALITRSHDDDNNNEEPVPNLEMPGSRRRSSASRKSKTGNGTRGDDLAPVLEEEAPKKGWLRNILSVFLIICAGAAGWAIAWKAGAWRPTPIADPSKDSDMPIGAAILGYASAVLYLGARIPQIAKNYRERSCEGLSILFFVLSVMGNLTYGAGVCTSYFPSCRELYILTSPDLAALSRTEILHEEPSLADRLPGHHG